MKRSQLILAILIVTLSGCAHPRVGENVPPEKLYELACRPGKSVKSVRGSTWLRAKSSEASGQFPAEVVADSPNQLKLEVTNLVGGTEAVITVKGEKYQIKVPNKKERSESGYGSWGGIPLHWATELFLGRVPCPQVSGAEQLRLSRNEEGELVVEVPPSLKGAKETFVYRFRNWEGKAWPEALHWEREGTLSASVDFKFDDPEADTLSPRKWEARSQQGEVKVRWKDRDVAAE